MKPLIFSTIHGSHLYGLSHADSDTDYYFVYEGTGKDLKQSVDGKIDTVRGDLPAFLTRALSGSHQSLEALFSHQKVYEPGMREKWGPFIESLLVTGSEVFAKYERTIKKFCYGGFKRRRHAVRLSFNLTDLRESGRFDPEMSLTQVRYADKMAGMYEGDKLKEMILP